MNESSKRCFVRDASEIVRLFRADARETVSDAWDETLNALKPGDSMPKPYKSSRDMRGDHPDKYNSLERRRQEALRKVSDLAEAEARNIRAEMLQPMSEQAREILADWKSYAPTEDEVRAFMDTYGDSFHAVQAANAVADGLGYAVHASHPLSAELQNVEQAAGVARAAINRADLAGGPYSSGEYVRQEMESALEGNGTFASRFFSGMPEK